MVASKHGPSRSSGALLPGLLARVFASVGLVLVLVLSTFDSSTGASNSSRAARSPSRINRTDTLWVFDADFEDLYGHNAGIGDLGAPGDSATGWYTYDHTAFPPQPSHWHRDSHLSYQDGSPPDSSFWCGRAHPCWKQMGYGNLWLQYLWRDFDLSAYAGLPVQLHFRQQLALEKGFDFGHVDVAIVVDSLPGTYSTVYSITNPGFGGAGSPQDWGSPLTGEVAIDISAFAGARVRIRWRVESDYSTSSEDTAPGSPLGPAVADGGWYIDEVGITADGTQIYHADFDDPIAPDNGNWNVESGQGGQSGIVWRRVPAGVSRQSPWSGRSYYLAATEAGSDSLCLGQRARLVSPLIPFPSCDDLILFVDGYFEPTITDPYSSSISASVGGNPECVRASSQFETVGWVVSAVPGTLHWFSSIDVSPTDDLLALMFQQEANAAPSGRGLMIDRVRVAALNPATGVPDESASGPIALCTPNPCASLATILVRAVPLRDVTLCVFTVAGREVLCVRGRCDVRGTYEYDWDGTLSDGSQVPSGVYLVRAECGGSTATTKLVRLR